MEQYWVLLLYPSETGMGRWQVLSNSDIAWGCLSAVKCKQWTFASPMKLVCAGDFKMHFMVKYAQWFLLIKSSTAATGLRFILSSVVFFYLLVMLRSSRGSDPAKIISSASFYFINLPFLGYFTVWFLGCFSMQLNLLLAQHLWNKD